jgi:hypothetical protein
MNFYVHEKLRELEAERQAYQLHLEYEPPQRRRPVFGGFASLLGRTLRRAGEGLEGWADVSPCEGERPLGQRAVR